MPDAHDILNLGLDGHSFKSPPERDCGLAKRYVKVPSHVCARVCKCPVCIPAFNFLDCKKKPPRHGDSNLEPSTVLTTAPPHVQEQPLQYFSSLTLISLSKDLIRVKLGFF